MFSGVDEPREDLRVTAERQLRLVGLLLILVGMSVTIVIERVRTTGRGSPRSGRSSSSSSKS
jgi:hypothetical protein